MAPIIKQNCIHAFLRNFGENQTSAGKKLQLFCFLLSQTIQFVVFLQQCVEHIRSKIRLVECNAKCRYLKQDFAADVLSVWGPPPSYDHILPPCTLYTCIQYIYLFTQERGREGGELTREKVRGAIVHKADRKYQHDWLCLQSINSI